MEKRDLSLDFLKGVACILMVFSHAAIKTTNPILLGLGYFGSFAAILFFSVTGITAWMQADHRTPKEILPPYMILFVAGFSLNGMVQIDFYKEFEVQMLQIIALGASLVFLVEHYFHPRTFYFFIIGVLLYFIKLLGDLLAQSVFFSQIFNSSWLQGWLFPPGTFTVIPWLFVFFLGVYAYQASARINLYLSFLPIAIFLGLLVYSQNPAQIDLVNKWDMSLSYFLFSCFSLFFSFALVKMFPIKNENIASRFLLFLGRNSLLFLYVHIFVVNVLFRLGFSDYIWLYWLLVLMLSSLLIYGTLIIYPKTNVARLFHSPASWVILTICVMFTPLVFRDPTIIFLLEFFWGVLLSMNYPLLKKIYRVKQPMPTDPNRITTS
jgi:fucose 4-O-acetylase-like acetyltransferase